MYVFVARRLQYDVFVPKLKLFQHADHNSSFSVHSQISSHGARSHVQAGRVSESLGQGAMLPPPTQAVCAATGYDTQFQPISAMWSLVGPKEWMLGARWAAIKWLYVVDLQNCWRMYGCTWARLSRQNISNCRAYTEVVQLLFQHGQIAVGGPWGFPSLQLHYYMQY